MILTFDKGGMGDLDTIYNLMETYNDEEMKDRVHMELLLSKKEYNLVFAVNDLNQLVGFMMYFETSNYIWLDFISVIEKFRRKSYGKQMIQKVIDEASDKDIGLFVEINTPDGDEYEEELGVLKWIEKCGLEKLPVPYKLASEFGDTKAYLYFKPSKKLKSLSGRAIEKVIEQSLREIHSDVFTIEDTIDPLKDLIENNKIYYRREPKRGLLGIIFGLGSN